MRKQFRAQDGEVLHLQTAEETLAVHRPGTKPMHLSLADIDRLREALDQARIELIQRDAGRNR